MCKFRLSSLLVILIIAIVALVLTGCRASRKSVASLSETQETEKIETTISCDKRLFTAYADSLCLDLTADSIIIMPAGPTVVYNPAIKSQIKQPSLKLQHQKNDSVCSQTVSAEIRSAASQADSQIKSDAAGFGYRLVISAVIAITILFIAKLRKLF